MVRLACPRPVARLAAALLAAAVGAACGPRVRPPADLFDQDDPAAVDGETPPTGARPAPAGRARPPVAAGAVARSDLLAVLDQGVGRFLAGVDIEPFFRDERFAGWEILRFWPGDPRYAAVDLRPGDVVASVNGREIKKPNQLAELWVELRTAAAIDIAGFRGGAPMTIHLAVVGDPP